MKVIEVLNKIANEEEMPQMIKGYALNWKWNKEQKDYIEIGGKRNLFTYYLDNLTDSLNDEFEIIEEDRPIEKINKSYSIKTLEGYDFEKIIEMCQDLYEKQQEIIGVVNELKKVGK